jgi:hypothetical protein
MRVFASSVISLTLLSGLLVLASCASGPQPRTETLAYAKLNNEHVYDYDFPTTWKGIEEAFRNYRVDGRDPSDVDPVELRKIHKRKLETDWIYGQSRDKIATIVIDKIPREQRLQTRIKYQILAETVFGGTRVTVKTTEELEKLNNDGSHAGYDRVEQPDPSRAAEVLDKIGKAILSAPPTAQPGEINGQ